MPYLGQPLNVSQSVTAGDGETDAFRLNLDINGTGRVSDLEILASAGNGPSYVRIGSYANQTTNSGTDNNGWDISASQTVSGDVRLLNVEDLKIDNAGAAAAGVHLGHSGVQAATSGLVNGPTATDQYGGVVTANQNIGGAISAAVTRSLEISTGATATDTIQLGHNASQTAKAANMRLEATGYPNYPFAPLATSGTVAAPGLNLNVIASQVTSGTIALTAAEMSVKNQNGLAVSSPTGSDILGSAPIAGVQVGHANHVAIDTQKDGRASSVSNIASTIALTTTSPTAAAGTDSTIATTLKGDITISTPDKAGVVQVGHTSTSQVSHNPAGGQATGKFLTMQSIGDVANTATYAININANHNLKLENSLGGTARIGDYITETSALSTTNAAVSPGSLIEQKVSSNINVNVGNSLGVLAGKGLAQIGHFSPASNEWQVTGTTVVTPQALNGAITVDVGTATAKAATGNTDVANIAGAKPTAGDLGNNNILINSADAAGTSRVGSYFAAGGVNKTQTANGNIWLRAGARFVAETAKGAVAVGHGSYASVTAPTTINPENATTGSLIRNRVSGNTSIGASQNSAAEDTNLAADYLVFDQGTGANAGTLTVNSGYGTKTGGDMGGQLRFFTSSQQNITIVGAPVFNDSGSNADATMARTASASNVFTGQGGVNHEHPFELMGSTPAYTQSYTAQFVGNGNYTFYFESQASTTTTSTSTTTTPITIYQPFDVTHRIEGGTRSCIDGVGGGMGGIGGIGGGGIANASSFSTTTTAGGSACGGSSSSGGSGGGGSGGRGNLTTSPIFNPLLPLPAPQGQRTSLPSEVNQVTVAPVLPNSPIVQFTQPNETPIATNISQQVGVLGGASVTSPPVNYFNANNLRLSGTSVLSFASSGAIVTPVTSR